MLRRNWLSSTTRQDLPRPRCSTCQAARDCPRDEDKNIEPQQTRVALFDDHSLIRDMIVSMLAVTPGLEVVASGKSAEDAIRHTEINLPDVIIMDVNMPGNGIAAATAINTVFPAVKIVILTSDDSEHMISAALHAGALAYVIKGGPMRELIATIKTVAAGHSYMSPSFAEKLLTPRALGAPWMDDAAGVAIEITEREEQILRRYAQGLTHEEIGMGLGLSPGTIAKFVTNILLKLHAYERFEPRANR
jgi:two-component system, NarL family, nitrate/nitrite response regulator NarL